MYFYKSLSGSYPLADYSSRQVPKLKRQMSKKFPISHQQPEIAYQLLYCIESQRIYRRTLVCSQYKAPLQTRGEMLMSIQIMFVFHMQTVAAIMYKIIGKMSKDTFCPWYNAPSKTRGKYINLLKFIKMFLYHI